MNFIFFSISSSYQTFHRKNEIESIAGNNEKGVINVIYFTSVQFLFSAMLRKIFGKNKYLVEDSPKNIKIHNLYSLLPKVIVNKSKIIHFVFMTLPIMLQVAFFKHKYKFKGETISWFYKPHQYLYLKGIGPYVYLHYDNYKADKTYDFSNNKEFDNILNLCIKNSHMSLICSSRLFKEYQKITNKNVYYYPNAISSNLISKKIDFEMINESKIIGFVGQLDKTFDEILIEKIAKKFNDYEIRLIGGINNIAVEEIASRYSNLTLVGYLDYSQLNEEIRKFSIGICPYVINDFNRYRNPLKIVEYFSYGIPVVTVPCDIDISIERMLSVANSYDEFIFCMEQEMMKNSQGKMEERIAFAEKNTWQSRAEFILDKIHA